LKLPQPLEGAAVTAVEGPITRWWPQPSAATQGRQTHAKLSWPHCQFMPAGATILPVL